MPHISDQQEFSDADWRVVAKADQSKKVALDVSGVSANTTRTLTIPNADGTIMLTSAIGVTVLGYDALLAAIAALTTAGGGFIRTTGVDTVVAQAIVGTVSQSGGTPTGALVERGSNANGEYARFADGTQVCWYEQGGFASITTASGSVFRSGAVAWTYPAAFIDGVVAVSGTATGTANWVGASSTSSTSANMQLFAPVSDGTARTLSALAVGRWF